MRSDLELLRLAGEALYGSRWQTPLSRDLNVSDRTIRNWSSGKHECPSDLTARLLDLLRTRGKNVEQVINMLEQKTDGIS